MFIQKTQMHTSNLATVCKKKVKVIDARQLISYRSILRFSVLDSPTCICVAFRVRRWRGWWRWQSGVKGDKSQYADQGGTPKLVSVNPGYGTLGQFPPCL